MYVGETEADAINRATIFVGNTLQRPDQLQKVEQYKRRVQRKKNLNFKKPKCSLDDLIKIVLSDGGEKSGMEIWKLIRDLFPFYIKCPKFTLHYVITGLRKNEAVDFKVLPSTQSNVQKRKYFLKKGVKVSFTASQIVEEGNDLKQYVSRLELLPKCVKTSCENLAVKAPSQNQSTSNKILTSTISPQKKVSVSPVDLKDSLDSKRRESKHSSHLEGSNTHNVFHIENVNLSAIETILEPTKTHQTTYPTTSYAMKQEREKEIHKSNRDINDKGCTLLPNQNANPLNVRKEDEGSAKNKRPLNEENHKRKRLRVSEESSAGGSSKEVREKKSPVQHKTNDFWSSSFAPSVFQDQSECKSRISLFTNIEGTLFSFPAMNSYSASMPLLSHMELHNKDEGEDNSRDVDDTGMDGYYLSVVSMKKQNELPDSTYESDDSTDRNFTLNLDRESGSSADPCTLKSGCGEKSIDCKHSEEEELVSSSDEPLAALPLESPNGACVSSSVVSPQIDIDVQTGLDEFEAQILRSEYKWISLNTERKKVLCSQCDNYDVVSSTASISEIKGAIGEHESSTMHVLFPALKDPTVLRQIYNLLRSAVTCTKSHKELQKEIYLILNENGIKKIEEKSFLQLLEIFRRHSHETMLAIIRKSRSPFSLILNFCRRFAILRTVDEIGSPYECVVVLENLRDRSVIGFLNSVNLSASRLMFFRIWPICRKCIVCEGKLSALSEHCIFELAVVPPRIEELYQYIYMDPFIFPYYSFVSELIRLYTFHPQRFAEIEGSRALVTETPLQLSRFVQQNLKLLKDSCRKLFYRDGEVPALGLLELQLELNETLMDTLAMIQSVGKSLKHIFYRDLSHQSLNEDTARTKLQNLVDEIQRSNIHHRIKEYLIDFMKEIIISLSITDHENTRFVEYLSQPSFLRTLDSSNSEGLQKLRNIFNLFEKYVDFDFQSLVAELQTFGSFVDADVKVVDVVLSHFEKYPHWKKRFPTAFKFFKLLIILPIPLATKNWCSPFLVQAFSGLIMQNFGREIWRCIFPMNLDLCSTKRFRSIDDFVNETVFLKSPVKR